MALVVSAGRMVAVAAFSLILALAPGLVTLFAMAFVRARVIAIAFRVRHFLTEILIFKESKTKFQTQIFDESMQLPL